MLARISTNMRSPDRPSRRPHGPRSACAPSSATSAVSAKSARRPHLADTRKKNAGPSMMTLRTSPPQMSLPHDADVEQDPLFNLPDQTQPPPRVPRRYCLKFLEIDSLSSDDESLFSFTASPVDSPSYTTTTFDSFLPPITPPSFLPSMSMSMSMPCTPAILVQRCGDGDSVDRWLAGGAPQTPLVAGASWDGWDADAAMAQADWRELVDRFLQHAELDHDNPLFPPTPGPDGAFSVSFAR